MPQQQHLHQLIAHLPTEAMAAPPMQLPSNRLDSSCSRFHISCALCPQNSGYISGAAFSALRLNGFSALITLESIPAILQAQSNNAICFGVIITGFNIPINSFNFSQPFFSSILFAFGADAILQVPTASRSDCLS